MRQIHLDHHWKPHRSPKHLNQLHQPNPMELAHHPASLLPFLNSLSHDLGRDRKLRWLALCAFCHPVLLPHI